MWGCSVKEILFSDENSLRGDDDDDDDDGRDYQGFLNHKRACL